MEKLACFSMIYGSKSVRCIIFVINHKNIYDMMKSKIMSVVALVSITLSMTALVGTLGVIALIPNEAAAQQQQQQQEEQEFDALLAGSFEVPPVNNTSGSGFGELGVVDNGNTVEYKVTVINMENVTKAHIRL